MSKVRSLVSNDIDLLDRAGDQLIAKLQMQAASLYDVYLDRTTTPGASLAYSGPNRPLIPIESGHLFRGKPR